MRAALLVFLLAVGVAMAWFWPSAEPAAESSRHAYLATAQQRGVVGYRDPAGALSPDGTRLAYSEGRAVHIVPVGGGVPQKLPPGEGQIRSLTWVGTDRLVAEDTGADERWWLFELSAEGATRRPVWADRLAITTSPATSAPASIHANELRQLTWSADGLWAAGLVNAKDGPELWRVSADGARAERRSLKGRPSAPAFTPSGEVACVSSEGGHPRLALPCGGSLIQSEPDVDVIGPLAFSPDGARAYFASPNGQGTVDLWSMELEREEARPLFSFETLRRTTSPARRLTSFNRDTYGPSVAEDGTVMYRLQTYRVFVADAPASGGETRQLATFQSETPSFHPTQPLLAFTFGAWRRLLDDAKYPDIAQDIGVIRLGAPGPAIAPDEVIAKSDSEDQAMAWSPNGKWIALHSHREMSDDVWLRPADGSGADRRITFLGRGAEVGWPRWSPDGRTVLLDGARKNDGRSVIYTIGVDQTSGQVTSDLLEVKAEGFSGELTHAEWMPSGVAVVALAKDGPGRQAIVTMPVTGGRVRVVHRFASEHDFSGLGVSPDGKSVAFSAPASDGHLQIFRMPIAGGAAAQVTSDPSNKSQPAWSPDGRRIAFTVWSYESAFWSFL
jgi:Tol biopolymer transport system component